MLCKRIIPCLDVLDGRVVKGVQFRYLRYAGDPPTLARIYEEQGADELVFLDIGASPEGRKTMVEVVERTADVLSVPLTVGGGVRSLADIQALLRAGADKVSVNTAAVKDPKLVEAAARRFGSQCVVVAIDAKMVKPRSWTVFIYGARVPTGLDAVEWAKRVADLGAGELLLTSIDCDGVQRGYDLGLTRSVVSAVDIPVIASGGAGNIGHIRDAFLKAGADAALAASIFHFGTLTVREVKERLRAEGVAVRM